MYLLGRAEVNVLVIAHPGGTDANIIILCHLLVAIEHRIQLTALQEPNAEDYLTLANDFIKSSEDWMKRWLGKDSFKTLKSLG